MIRTLRDFIYYLREGWPLRRAWWQARFNRVGDAWLASGGIERVKERLTPDAQANADAWRELLK